MTGTIYIVDATDWCEQVIGKLRVAGFVVLRARSAEEAERLVRRRPPDCVTAVDSPPAVDALALASRMRDVVGVPVTIVSSPQDEVRFLAGFAAGASDVVAPDCAPSVFIARLRAVFRRVAELPDDAGDCITIGAVSIEPASGQAFMHGNKAHLTPLEFSLLLTFMRDPGVVYSRQDLLDSVWGSRDVALVRTVDAHIWKLRRKLEVNAASPQYIVSVPRLGYRFRRSEECSGLDAQPAVSQAHRWASRLVHAGR